MTVAHVLFSILPSISTKRLYLALKLVCSSGLLVDFMAFFLLVLKIICQLSMLKAIMVLANIYNFLLLSYSFSFLRGHSLDISIERERRP